MMARVRSANTAPELSVRRALHAAGYRFRLHRRDLPGRPDLVMPKHRMAVFVNGCFWHGHSCPKGRLPKTNEEFWRAKIGRNAARDAAADADLASLGWIVRTIWECDLDAGIENLKAHLNGGPA
jgi:DNA mismatch endonuclease (patch repair protein)